MNKYIYMTFFAPSWQVYKLNFIKILAINYLTNNYIKMYKQFQQNNTNKKK